MNFFGSHLLKGMLITLKRFALTYVWDVKRLCVGHKAFKNGKVSYDPNDHGIFTIQYPEQQLKMPERFRVLPVLIYDTDPHNPRCTACGICAKVCPPQCIWIVQAKDETNKPKQLPSEFYIDTNVCMNCGLCAEYCPFDAIKMDPTFEISTYTRRPEEVYDLKKLLVTADYYAETHPQAWAQEEKMRKAKKGAAAPGGGTA